MAIQTQFAKLLNDIEPSRTTKQNAAKAHSELRDYLASHETYQRVHVSTFLAGSYRRDSAIRPRTKYGVADRPDIDIIVVTNHTRNDNPEAVINELFLVLKQRYTSHRKQGRSVGVFTTLADMDVVPVIEETDLFGNVVMYVPDRERKIWVRTNPAGHTQWTTEVNKRAGERFKPLVKLLKWWRRENPWWNDNTPSPQRKPKGFQLECIVAECMSYSETQWDELFVTLLERIRDGYALYVALGVVPTVQDPAVPGNDVMAGVEPEVFKRFHNIMDEHATMGRRAIELEETNPAEALALWRKIFGPRFPASGQSQSEASNITPAVAPSFPDRKVVPDRGPKGFA